MVRAVRLPLQTTFESVAVLTRRGMLRPVRPDRLMRAGVAFARWGTTPATAAVVNAITRPAQAALIDADGPVTWQELDRHTNAIARGFAELGAEPGGRIGILCRNGAGLVEATIASAKLGAHALMLNTSFSAAELKGVLEREEPSVVVHDEEFTAIVREATPPGARQVVVGSSSSRRSTLRRRRGGW
jgi:fatty-acyl-CoA synthase